MPACQVEVVASTVEDVLAAAAGGADRVEFCVHLPSGGLTPGRTLVEAGLEVARDKGLGFRVLVRPREGNFVYSEAERKAIVAEAEACLALGADRVVTGALDASGLIDMALLSELDAAVGLERVVFHRAFDEAADHAVARQQLLDSGIRTVLTSGGKATAMEGVDGIRESVASGLTVVAGAGVQSDHVSTLLAAGVEAVHASCRVPFSGTKGRLFDVGRTCVGPELVQALVTSVASADRP